MKTNKYNTSLYQSDIVRPVIDIENKKILTIDFNSQFAISFWEEANYDISDICEKINISGVTIELNKIDSEVFCMHLNDDSFSGGFYQINYKQEGYNYQVLPNEYPNGFGYEIWFKKNENITIDDDEVTVNQCSIDNEGFLYYWGLKKENPYCGRIITGQTCERIDYNPLPEIIEKDPTENINPLLYYNNENIICNPYENNIQVVYPDCCEGVIDNTFGVRLTSDDKINVRVITTSGECVDNAYYSGITVVNYYSEEINLKEWNHLIMNFTPYNCDNEGTLEFWINGYLVYKIEDFKMIVPYGLDIDRSLQTDNPYTMSFGGGTLGNMENDYMYNLNESETVCEYEFCFGSDLSVSGITIDGNNFSVEDGIRVEEKNMLDAFFNLSINGVLESELNEICPDVFIYKAKVTSADKLQRILFTNNTSIEINKIRCVEYIKNPPCTLIQDNYAGTFIGQIDCFNLFNEPLNYEEIKLLSQGKYYVEEDCC